MIPTTTKFPSSVSRVGVVQLRVSGSVLRRRSVFLPSAVAGRWLVIHCRCPKTGYIVSCCAAMLDFFCIHQAPSWTSFSTPELFTYFNNVQKRLFFIFSVSPVHLKRCWLLDYWHKELGSIPIEVKMYAAGWCRFGLASEQSIDDVMSWDTGCSQ